MCKLKASVVRSVLAVQRRPDAPMHALRRVMTKFRRAAFDGSAIPSESHSAAAFIVVIVR